MTLEFFLKEAFRAMRRNAAPSFAAFATIVVTLIVVGAFIPIVQASQGAADAVSHKVLVNVFMKDNATNRQEARVRRELMALPNVKSVSFESKTVALKQQEKTYPNAGYNILSSNPLPDTFHVTPTSPGEALTVRSEIERGKGYIDPAIENLSGQTTQTKRLLEVTNLVTWIATVLTLLLVIASVVLIANTIRLSLYARRQEIEVMKLVGATDWFIRWPFVIEGIIVGAGGAIASICLLGAVKFLLLDPLAGSWQLISTPHTIPFPLLVLVLIGAGVAVSAAGSGLSLRQFLRV
jgi:cell division transport system permease protein